MQKTQAQQNTQHTASTSTQDSSNQDTEESARIPSWAWIGLAVIAVLGISLVALNAFDEGKTPEKTSSVKFRSEYGVDSRLGIRWRDEVNKAPILSTAVVEEGIVFVNDDRRTLTALGTRGGQEQWNFDLKDSVSTSPVVEDGIVYVGTDQGITALHGEEGKYKWGVRTGEIASTQPFIKSGTVYFATENGRLYALNAENGEEQWRVQVGEGAVSALAFAEKYLKSHREMVFAGQGQTVAAFDAKTGQWQWAQQVEGGSVSALTTYGHSNVYAGISAGFRAGSGNIYSFNIDTGDVDWYYDNAKCDDEDVMSNCDISYLTTGADVLYAQTSATALLSIDLNTIEENEGVRKKWSIDFNPHISSGAPEVLTTRERILVPSVDAIHSVDTNSGKSVWDLYIDTGSVTPSVGRGGIYAVTRDKIYAIDGV